MRISIKFLRCSVHLLLGCAAVGGLLTSVDASAQEFPERALRLIVPTPAGEPTDAAARILAQSLSKLVGQPVNVENRPGASGAIAAQAVLDAPADGHTLLMGSSALAGIPMLQRSSPFQSLAELTPVSSVGHIPFGMFVHPSIPAKTVMDFTTFARANGERLSFATGPLTELMAASLFMKATAVNMQRIPYKGVAQIMPDLVRGRVQANFGPVRSAMPHVSDGKLRMLAVLAPQRLALAPDVPTMAEAGFAMVLVPTWQAVFAPPKTSRHAVLQLAHDIAQVVASPAARAQYERLLVQVDGSSPDALAGYVERAIYAWRTFVRENDIVQE
jgi:tripartite-type tricarboxylate transporter receptor subunit TctC